MQGVWNIGFVENTLDGVINGEPLKIKWLNHECKDRWFADPFILDVTDDKIYVLVEEYYYPHTFTFFTVKHDLLPRTMI